MAADITWNSEKDDWLYRRRGVRFDEIASAIRQGRVLDMIPHPNQRRYPGQQIYYVEISGYAYAVPFVTEPDGTRFLKTAFPSRKATRDYLGGQR